MILRTLQGNTNLAKNGFAIYYNLFDLLVWWECLSESSSGKFGERFAFAIIWFKRQ